MTGGFGLSISKTTSTVSLPALESSRIFPEVRFISECCFRTLSNTERSCIPHSVSASAILTAPLSSISRNSCSRAFSRPNNSACSDVIPSSFSARSLSTADTRIWSERVSSGKRWRLVSTIIRLAYSSVMSFPSPIRQGTFTHMSCSATVRRRFPDSISYSPFPAERTRSGSVMPIRAIDELSSDRSPQSVKIGERRGSSLSNSIL